MIQFRLYNIRNGRNGGLDSALRTMDQASIELGVLEETKINERIYTQELSWYRVVALDALNWHRGGVNFSYRELLHFAVKNHQKQGPNVVKFQMELGGRIWFVVSRYLAPDASSSIERVIRSISQRPWGTTLMVSKYFNTHIMEPEDNAREQVISAAVVTAGLEEMSVQLLLHYIQWAKDGRNWIMQRQGQEVRSWNDYILRKD